MLFITLCIYYLVYSIYPQAFYFIIPSLFYIITSNGLSFSQNRALQSGEGFWLMAAFEACCTADYKRERLHIDLLIVLLYVSLTVSTSS